MHLRLSMRRMPPTSFRLFPKYARHPFCLLPCKSMSSKRKRGDCFLCPSDVPSFSMIMTSVGVSTVLSCTTYSSSGLAVSGYLAFSHMRLFLFVSLAAYASKSCLMALAAILVAIGRSLCAEASSSIGSCLVCSTHSFLDSINVLFWPPPTNAFAWLYACLATAKHRLSSFFCRGVGSIKTL